MQFGQAKLSRMFSATMCGIGNGREIRILEMRMYLLHFVTYSTDTHNFNTYNVNELVDQRNDTNQRVGNGSLSETDEQI